MICIKTGCTVLVKDLLYHGDLFLGNDELILKGVFKSKEGYSNKFNGQNYHCEAGNIEFLGQSSNGYGQFAIFDGVMPKEDFYKFLNQWANCALPYFIEVN